MRSAQNWICELTERCVLVEFCVILISVLKLEIALIVTNRVDSCASICHTV